jgi:hypothetical protein
MDVILRRVCVTIFAVYKQYITHYECVSVALFTQIAKRMRRFIFSSVACMSVRIFLRYPINGTIFGGGGGWLNMEYVFFFSLQPFCETFSSWEKFSYILP